MALSTLIVCEQCGREKRVMHRASEFPPKICSECEAYNEKEKRTQELARLASLSVEERLSLLEAWIYDYEPYIPPELRRLG